MPKAEKKAEGKPQPKLTNQKQKQEKHVKQEARQEKSRRRNDHRGPDVEGRSRTKDSTQQASLMKPYYLNQDD